jgi:hypothetical protein
LNATPGKKSQIHSLLLKSALTNNATPGKIVTISDEAFALLLYDNYIEKWIDMVAEKRNEQMDMPAQAGGDNRNKKKAAARRRGKSTRAAMKTGQCKFGGWSKARTNRFNAFYDLTKEDRGSPQVAEIEQKLLEFCNSKRPSTDGDGAVAEGQEREAAARILSNFAPPVEARWDSIEEL